MENTAISNQERLPWHKPEVQRITVNFDTGFRLGSITDLDQTGAVIPQDEG
jgi:hypothetical protein